MSTIGAVRALPSLRREREVVVGSRTAPTTYNIGSFLSGRSSGVARDGGRRADDPLEAALATGHRLSVVAGEQAGGERPPRRWEALRRAHHLLVHHLDPRAVRRQAKADPPRAAEAFAEDDGGVELDQVGRLQTADRTVPAKMKGQQQLDVVAYLRPDDGRVGLERPALAQVVDVARAHALTSRCEAAGLAFPFVCPPQALDARGLLVQPLCER